MTISTKAQMYQHLRAGRFGNTLRSWPSREAMLKDGFSGLVGLRYAGKLPGGLVLYDLTQEQAVESFKQAIELGADPKLIQWCEAAPDKFVRLQGEIVEAGGDYHLHYSTEKAQMRPALAKGPKWHSGPGALLICKSVMDPSSYDDLRGLLEDFPGHAIEFSCYSINLGVVPRRNCIFWEVRKF